MVASLVTSAVRVLQVTSMARALLLTSRVMAMLTGGVAGVVLAGGAAGLPVRRVLTGMLWAVVSSVVPMVGVMQAMHQVTVGPLCAVGDALRMGVRGPEGGLPLVQPAMVVLVMPVVRVSQVMDRATVLLVMSMAGRGGVLVRLMVPAARVLHVVQRPMVRVP